MKMFVRTAKDADAAAIADLISQLGYELTIDGARQRMSAIRNTNDALFMAEVDARVVGLIQVSRMEALEHDPRAEIRALIVDEKQRGSGVGKALVDKAEAWAKERSLTMVRVRSNIKRERTRLFYERNGYAVTKTQNVFDKKL
jgi:GNAT superfamily N-acetyltransferase